MWNLKYGTDETTTEQNHTHGQGEQTCSCGEGGVGWTGSAGLVDANYYI